MAPSRFHARSASQALTTSYAIFPIGTDDGPEIPESSYLSLVWLELSSISSATTITWYLAVDDKGDYGITPPQTDTILTGATTAANGTVARGLDIERVHDTSPAALTGTSPGRLYLVAKTNAGTATAIGHLSGHRLG